VFVLVTVVCVLIPSAEFAKAQQCNMKRGSGASEVLDWHIVVCSIAGRFCRLTNVAGRRQYGLLGFESASVAFFIVLFALLGSYFVLSPCSRYLGSAMQSDQRLGSERNTSDYCFLVLISDKTVVSIIVLLGTILVLTERNNLAALVHASPYHHKKEFKVLLIRTKL